MPRIAMLFDSGRPHSRGSQRVPSGYCNVIPWTLRRQFDLLNMEASGRKGRMQRQAWLGHLGTQSCNRCSSHKLPELILWLFLVRERAPADGGGQRGGGWGSSVGSCNRRGAGSVKRAHCTVNSAFRRQAAVLIGCAFRTEVPFHLCKHWREHM